MFTKLIRAILGMVGIIKKTLKFDNSHNDEFKQSLEAGTIILTHSEGALQSGIQAASGSAWCHALLYVGKSASEKVRKKYPEIMKNKKMTKEAQYNEIIEAQGGGIQIDNLNKNLVDSVQLTGFTRKLTENELMTILHRAYSNVGKNYGYLDFISELFPDPSAVNLGEDNGFICSALCVDTYIPVENLCLPKVDLQKMTPGQLYESLNRRLNWKKTTWNW